MRVLFLDFDGVLNATTDDFDASLEMWSAAWLVPAMVQRLSALIEATGAVVVVSSSWRLRRSLDELRDILRAHGFAGQVVDVTPRGPRGEAGERGVREQEILDWLDQHRGVERFVILDDDGDFTRLTDRHVRTDAAVGLTDADVERAARLLGAPW